MTLTEMVLTLIASIFFFLTLHYRAKMLANKLETAKAQYFLDECRGMLKWTEEQLQLSTTVVAAVKKQSGRDNLDYCQMLDVKDTTILDLTGKLQSQTEMQEETAYLEWLTTGKNYDWAPEPKLRYEDKMFRELSNAKAKSRTGKMSDWGRK